ncbi:MAG TPA: VOC family protein [Ramlibacter sp.]|uniref:VOC family protein n=1 Tax=Ramlibacter sp. TaxID=1917967 RepID=UPI002CEF7FF8|nr:VOC family protein [Ramlibacter sp.]HVZ46524.1 VOC family protein [Ramlibacter sp.]
MGDAVITGLRSIELEVADVARSFAFYESVWGLERLGASPHLRAGGMEHHALSVYAAAQPGLRSITLAARDDKAVDSLCEKARNHGVPLLAAGHELEADDGGGYGACFEAPGGLRVRVSGGVARQQAGLRAPDKPVELTHVVLNSPDLAQLSDWFCGFLGFKVSDETAIMRFLRCGADHHTIAIARGTCVGLNHAAFLMEDFDGLMYGCGRLTEAGYPIEWGVGRHGPGNNVFAYFIDPDGHVVEYTTDMDQVDDTYVVHDAAYWGNFPRRPCRWGLARKPSERIMKAMAGTPRRQTDSA